MIIPVQIRLSRTLIAIRWWCRKHCVDSEPWYNTECLLSTKGSALQHYIISPTPLCLCSIGAIVFHDCHLLSLALYGLSCYITTGTGKPITYLSPTRYRTQFGVLEIWKSRTLGKTSVKKISSPAFMLVDTRSRQSCYPPTTRHYKAYISFIRISTQASANSGAFLEKHSPE